MYSDPCELAAWFVDSFLQPFCKHRVLALEQRGYQNGWALASRNCFSRFSHAVHCHAEIVSSKGRASKTNGRSYGIAAQDQAQDRRMMAAPFLCNHVQSSLPFPQKASCLSRSPTSFSRLDRFSISLDSSRRCARKTDSTASDIHFPPPSPAPSESCLASKAYFDDLWCNSHTLACYDSHIQPVIPSSCCIWGRIWWHVKATSTTTISSKCCIQTSSGKGPTPHHALSSCISHISSSMIKMILQGVKYIVVSGGVCSSLGKAPAPL